MFDEFGYQRLDREESNLFFRVVNYRYSKGSSTAITTNKGIASWPSVLADDEVLAGAILDRLLHNTTVLNIQGRSYRLKELDEKLSRKQVESVESSAEAPADAASLPAGGKPTGSPPEALSGSANSDSEPQTDAII